MLTMQIQNDFFAELYQMSYATDRNGHTVLDLQRVSGKQKGTFVRAHKVARLVELLYGQSKDITVRLNGHLPPNEILHWLKQHQQHFTNLQIDTQDGRPRLLGDFFANRAQTAIHFINQVTAGHADIPTLPLRGWLPTADAEPFYLTEWRREDVAPLAASIERMYTHWQRCQDNLARNNNRIDASNMGDSYRIFWFFEDMNEHNTAQAMAERFILRSYLESTAPERDVYRLAIRDKNGNVVGGITVNMLPCPDAPLAEQGDIGYFVDPSYAGQRYVSSAMDLLLPFYFRTHNVLSLDIVSTPLGQEAGSSADNLLSQRTAKHFGATQSSEAPHKDFADGGYIPWCLHREDFCANRYEHICRVFRHASRSPELLLTQRPGMIGNVYSLQR